MRVEKLNSRAAVLDTIRRAKRIARIDLAQKTHISQATVTTITADMIRQGLIEEVEREEQDQKSRRGRPRVDLKLRADAFLVAGLKIAESTISVVLVNFEGVVIHQHKHVRNTTVLPAGDLVRQINQALDQTFSGIEHSLNDLSAIGVGIAGIVDARHGFVHWSPLLTEKNFDFRSLLSAAFGMPVYLDNDANLVAMAEQYFGDAQHLENFIVVTIEAGVGMGIVIDNKVYRGARGCGAEFGHTKVHLDGALCRCGQRGCLEAYVADYALLREASFGMPPETNSSTEKRLQDLLSDARAGNKNAESIINRSSRIFAMGLSNLVNLFDPELIILSGERMSLDHLYASEVMEMIKASIVQVDAEPPEIVVHKWGDFMWARGAASFAIAGVVEQSLNEGSESVA